MIPVPVPVPVPAASELWTNPEELILTWQQQPEKLAQEETVSRFVGEVDYVADLGCGCGRHAHALRFNKYWGFDQSVQMIEAAKDVSPRSAEFSVVDIFRFEPGIVFDALVMIDVAIHHTNPIDAIVNIWSRWQAKKYVFSLLVGNKHEDLLNTVVVSGDEAHPILAEAKRLTLEPVRGESFNWYLIEVGKWNSGLLTLLQR